MYWNMYWVNTIDFEVAVDEFSEQKDNSEEFNKYLKIKNLKNIFHIWWRNEYALLEFDLKVLCKMHITPFLKQFDSTFRLKPHYSWVDAETTFIYAAQIDDTHCIDKRSKELLNHTVCFWKIAKVMLTWNINIRKRSLRDKTIVGRSHVHDMKNIFSL